MQNDVQIAREKALQDAKLYMANGWELKEETPEYFLLHRRQTSTMVHIILFLCTFGIGNIIYYLAALKTKKIFK